MGGPRREGTKMGGLPKRQGTSMQGHMFGFQKQSSIGSSSRKGTSMGSMVRRFGPSSLGSSRLDNGSALSSLEGLSMLDID